jgi:hypothetical protein
LVAARHSQHPCQAFPCGRKLVSILLRTNAVRSRTEWGPKIGVKNRGQSPISDDA